MKHKVFAVLFALGLNAGLLQAQSVPLAVSIDNFGRIDPNYYRGAQPNAAGFRQLKQLGIKTVIDLQKNGERNEPAWVRDAGLQYFNIPLTSKIPATAAQTEYFLKLVNDPNNWPVYVHCKGGRHRTGAMTAIYRITHDRWTADRAYQEMKQYKYYSFGGHGLLRGYVYRFYELFAAAQAAGQPASAGSMSSVADQQNRH
jgi:protein tyrosine/serine phosphatase